MTKDKTARIAVLPGWVPERTAAIACPAEPWRPAPFDDSDQRALKALRDGTATSEQQQRALGWIFFASGYRNDPFRAGADGDRLTAYATGKQVVARQIYDMLEAAVRGSSETEQGST